MTISNYGTGPAGVSVSVNDGFVQNVTIGRPQKCILFARGDLATASANANEPTALRFRPDAEDLFGTDSELASELRSALDAGAQKRTVDDEGNVVPLLYGVMPDENSVSGEQIAGGTGTLDNAPIIEDVDEISVTPAASSTDITVEFVYEDDPVAPTAADTMAVNPNNGAVEASDGGDYEVDYKYLDYETAFDSARDIIEPSETGMWGVCSEATAVATSLSSWMDTLRKPYRMVRSVIGAQPNATGPEGEPLLNVLDDSGNVVYTNPLNDDATFMAGNVRRPSGNTIVGGIVGKMAGNQLRNPIFGDEVPGYTEGVVQTLRPDEQNELARNGIIPIGNTNNTLTLEDSCTTYQYETGDYLDPESLTTWPRDYYRRRVIDQVILTGNAAGKFGQKRELDDQTLKLVEEQFKDDIETFIEAGLLQSGSPGTGAGATGQTPNDVNGAQPGGQTTEDQQGYSVDTVALAPDTIGIASTVTPTGVAKHAEVRLSVARQRTQSFAEAGGGTA